MTSRPNAGSLTRHALKWFRCISGIHRHHQFWIDHTTGQQRSSQIGSDTDWHPAERCRECEPAEQPPPFQPPTVFEPLQCDRARSPPLPWHRPVAPGRSRSRFPEHRRTIRSSALRLLRRLHAATSCSTASVFTPVVPSGPVRTDAAEPPSQSKPMKDRGDQAMESSAMASSPARSRKKATRYMALWLRSQLSMGTSSPMVSLLTSPSHDQARRHGDDEGRNLTCKTIADGQAS